MPDAPSRPVSRRLIACLVALLVLAFALRFGSTLAVHDIDRPDEVFQNLEPAHRMWSGWGVVTWEWRSGIRSWLLPGALAGLMGLSAALGVAYLPLIAATLSLLSLGVVVTGAVIGWRRAGLAGAVLCGLLCAVWPDLVYFAPKTLGEIQGGNLLVIAAGLASARQRPWADGFSRAILLAVGALLGLVFCLRFQLAPAALVIAVCVGRRNIGFGWLPLMVGAAVPLLALGVVDYLSWGSPFQSIWKNLVVNIVDGRSETYGVSAVYYYAGKLAQGWGAALLPILLFFCLGATAAPLMVAIAVVTVLSHSLIAHKEIGFIYAAIPPILIVAGLGTARVVAAVPRLFRAPPGPRSVLAIAAALWLAVAALTGVAATRRPNAGNQLLPVWLAARQEADLCGLGLYGADFPWWRTGGYAYLDRAVPIYLLRTPAELAAAQPGLDYLIVDNALEVALQDYQRVTCLDGYCLMRQRRACTEVPDREINAVLAREGH